ncbi:MAG: pseudouridine synthase [Clostridia bacterium]|nr:pseudouridine synthase [Clostridia bacterium]
MRLQKFMAQCGVASRRKSEEIITQGRVKVNGKTASQPGLKIKPGVDKVTVDGKKIVKEDKKIYILLNKPSGCVTTADDQFGRKKVLDYIGDINYRIYPVGRLDYETEGLLILTNDGELTNKLLHPRNQVEKRYLAILDGVPSSGKLHIFKKGIRLEDGITSPAFIKINKIVDGNAVVTIGIKEGRNRQIRRMCQRIGHKVLYLKRIAIQNLEIGSLQPGQWRLLNNKEINYLKSL